MLHFAIVTLCLLAGAVQAQQLAGFGEHQNQASIAVDINARGQVAGIIEDQDYHQRAVLFEQQRLVELGTLGGPDAYTKGINADGAIVGAAQNTSKRWRAFVWRAGEGMRDLGTLGGASSYAAAINRHGQIVGFADTPADYFHAFLFDGGRMSDLGTLGGQISYAAAISEHGNIVGTAALADGYRHAFLYQPGSGMRDLGTLGGRQSSATAVNAGDQVVGAAETSSRRWHAFLWQNGQMSDLGALIGYGDSFATSINAAGHVVGTVHIGDERRTFVYRDGKMTVHPGFYGLYVVNAINGQEQVIGARFVAKKFIASTMHSSQPAVATHGGQDLVLAAAGVLACATALMLYRRRYRGIRMAARIR